MQELLITIVKGLVENPDAVSVTVDEVDERGIVVYHLHVAEEDMGRVIGKQGRIAKAIRTVMRAAAVKDGKKVIVDIVETGSTLKENNLEVRETIVPISARLISNKSSFKFKNEMIEKIRAGLEQQVVEKND